MYLYFYLGLWKRLKISTREKLNSVRNEIRKTGGGPPPSCSLDPAEEIMSGIIGRSSDPLQMEFDDDATAFQVTFLYSFVGYVMEIPSHSHSFILNSCGTGRANSKCRDCLY